MSGGASPARAPVLDWIQYLRGAAALMVVFYHVSHWGEQPWMFDPLEAFTAPSHGVAIFFVISGFIMYTAARDEPALEFYRRRIIRIVPLYWLATLVPIAVAWLAGEMFSRLSILKSLLFIPFHNPSHGGAIWPLLIPGWTLNYEMFFYLLFGLAIALGRPVLTLSITILGLVAIGRLTAFDNAILFTYTNPRLFEFLAGVWLGVAFRHLDFSKAAPLLPLGFILLLISDWTAWPRPLEITLPSIAIVAGALGFQARGVSIGNRTGLLIGNASYAIYLVHTLLIAELYRLFKRLPVEGWAQFLSLTACILIAATLAGIAIHLHVEKPLTRLLSGFFVKRRLASAI